NDRDKRQPVLSRRLGKDRARTRFSAPPNDRRCGPRPLPSVSQRQFPLSHRRPAVLQRAVDEGAGDHGRGGMNATVRSHLDELESGSIYILREALRCVAPLCMLWSMGKDSTALLWLARKAFFGKVPFPVVQLDTGME